MKPCVKNHNVMILNLDDNINIILIGIDKLVDCRDDIEKETVKNIAKLINVKILSRGTKRIAHLQKNI